MTALLPALVAVLGPTLKNLHLPAAFVAGAQAVVAFNAGDYATAITCGLLVLNALHLHFTLPGGLMPSQPTTPAAQ